MLIQTLIHIHTHIHTLNTHIHCTHMHLYTHIVHTNTKHMYTHKCICTQTHILTQKLTCTLTRILHKYTLNTHTHTFVLKTYLCVVLIHFTLKNSVLVMILDCFGHSLLFMAKQCFSLLRGYFLIF